MELTRVDLKQKLKHLYNPAAKAFASIVVPPMNFLMIDGSGDPNGQSYKEVIETLYAVAYPIKFAIKKQQNVDYGVMPLEGLWWSNEEHFDFTEPNRAHWQWTMMLMQPEYVSADLVSETVAEVKRKKQPPAIERVRFEAFDEGLSAQIMHIGPYSAEHPTIMAMHRFIQEAGYALHGKHHEIYLGDPNRSAQEKLKTVLRQPIRAK